MMFDFIRELAGRIVFPDTMQRLTYVAEKTSGAGDFSRQHERTPVRCKIHITYLTQQRSVGRISLLALPNEQTRFVASVLEQKFLGMSVMLASNSDYFGYFLKQLNSEFRHQGFVGSYRQEQPLTTESPKVFIAHGGECQALTKLRDYTIDLGIEPLIVEKVASESRSVNEQVEYNLAQADCAIVLGTADDKNLADGRLYPRDNVEIEIGRFQERFPRRTIYLLEKGASFPSNISEKVYERFTQDNMEKAFAKVARELTAFGILKAVKPAEKKANA